ncbi:MAG: RNA polymerase sigma factor [Saprospiraceae bacterium]
MTNTFTMKVNSKQGSPKFKDSDLENIFLEGIEQNKQKLLRICSAYANDEEEKKDLFQEVLVNIWKSMHSFKGKSAISTWMYRVTLNVCINVQTKLSKKKKQFISMDSVTLARYEKQTSGVEEESPLLQYLRSCIKAMNESDRAVIALYLEELPYKEISEVTGLTENNVAVKIKRMKTKLLNCINEKS